MNRRILLKHLGTGAIVGAFVPIVGQAQAAVAPLTPAAVNTYGDWNVYGSLELTGRAWRAWKKGSDPAAAVAFGHALQGMARDLSEYVYAHYYCEQFPGLQQSRFHQETWPDAIISPASQDVFHCQPERTHFLRPTLAGFVVNEDGSLWWRTVKNDARQALFNMDFVVQREPSYWSCSRVVMRDWVITHGQTLSGCSSRQLFFTA